MKLYTLFRDIPDGMFFKSTDDEPLRCIKLQGPYGKRVDAEDGTTFGKLEPANAFCFDTMEWRFVEQSEGVCTYSAEIKKSILPGRMTWVD